MTKIRISLVALGMEMVDQHWKRDLWELMRKWGHRNQNAPNFFVPTNEREIEIGKAGEGIIAVRAVGI